MKILTVFVGLSLCLPARAQGRNYLLEPLTALSPGHDLPGKAPDYLYFEASRPSPDGKYMARLVVGDGEVSQVAIYRLKGGVPHFTKGYAVSSWIESVGACVWIPGHGHWLAFATDMAYGKSSLGIWTAGPKVRWLVRPSNKDDGYNIRGVSADGCTLIYEHFGENSP